MTDLDVMIRESLHAYIDFAPNDREPDRRATDGRESLTEPTASVPRRRSRALVLVAAALGALGVIGLVAISVSSRTSTAPAAEPAPLTNPRDQLSEELDAGYLPLGFKVTSYQRANFPAATSFDSSWYLEGPGDQLLRIARHETLGQSYAGIADGQVAADQQPEGDSYGFSRVEGDTLLVVQGWNIPDAPNQLKRVIEGLRITEAGNCIIGTTPRSDGVCAAGTVDDPDTGARHDTATTLPPPG